MGARGSKKQFVLKEFRLLQKYIGIRFHEEEEEVAFKIIDTYVEWKKKDKTFKETPFYRVLAKPVNAAGDDDSDLESFHINEELFRIINHPNASHPLNFDLIHEP